MRYLSASILIFLLFQTSFAFDQFGMYYSELGYGSVKNNGIASVNMGTGRGLDGGVFNPANYFIDRNEIAADISLITALTRQSGVKPPVPKVFMGRVGYLVNKGKNTFVINYYPRTMLNAGASYSSQDRVAELAFSNLELAWARKVNNLNYGFAATYVFGNFWNGFDYSSSSGLEDRVTKYKTRGYAFKAGISYDRKGLSYGISLESGIEGKSKVVGDYELDYDFNTPWILRVGIGGKGKKSEINFQTDFFIFETKDVLFGEGDIVSVSKIETVRNEPELDVKFATGLSWQYSFNTEWKLLSGLKYAHLTEELLDHILNFGLGVEYNYTENISFYGSLGAVHSLEDRFASLDDTWPLTLMAGFKFYEGK